MKSVRKQSKCLFALLLCFCTVLCLLIGMLPVMAADAEENGPANAVRYLDASGSEAFVTEFTEVTSATTTISDGWYVVKGFVRLAEKITVTGTVHLILCDKATLETPGVLLAKGNSLSIYAQSEELDRMGSLISESSTSGQAGIGGFKGGSGTLVINGGNISATSTNSFSAAIGCGSSSAYASAYSCDPITINGGVVTAASGANAAAIGGSMNSPGCTVVVNGGIVTAKGGRNGSGIGGGRAGGGGNFTQNGGIVLATCGHSDITHHAIPIGNGANSTAKGTAIYNGGITFLSGVGKLNTDSFTLDQRFDLPADATLTVESGKTLTVAESGYIANSGTLVNNGTIVNNGGILNEGTFTNSGSGSCGLYAKDHPMLSDACAFCGSVAAPKLSNGVYYVSSADHLYWLAEQINAGGISGTINIELVNDITITADRPWTPIVLPDGQSCIIEGNGHTIDMDLTDETESEDNYSLFSSLNYSTVRNLVLEGSVFANTTGNVAALAASAYRTTFENIVSFVNITNTCTEGGYAGGIVGYFGGKHDYGKNQYSKLINCAVYADVVGYYAGGIIGHSWNGTQYYDMTGCLYVGDVNANGGAAGAIVGYQETDSNTCTFTNVFWNETDGLSFYGKRDTTNQVYNNTSARTVEDFASGAIAWELNGGVTDGSQAWYQNLDEDDYPLLSGPAVYHGYNHVCADTEPIYSNAANYLKDTHADHTYTTACSTTCKYCGYERTPSVEHTVETRNDADQHWKYCTVCGLTWDYGEHSMRYQDNETGSHTYLCTDCGYIEKTEGHWYEDKDLGDGTHVTQCIYCLRPNGEPVAHTLVTTDTGEGSHITHCETCSYTEKYATTHSMVYTEQEGGTHKYYCTVCNYVEKITGHDVIAVDNGDGTHVAKCAYCTYIDVPEAHIFEFGVCCICGCVEISEPACVNGVYQISNVGELYWFAQLVNGGTTDASAELISDVVVNRDIAGEWQTYRLATWTPIGADVEFTGSFNGNYHTVSGLYMKGSATTLGLIGNLSGSTVCNVGVIDSYFETDANNSTVGGVVASNNGTVRRCWFDGTMIIHGADVYCGGVVGYNGYEKLTENCYNLGDITCNYDGESGGITTVGGVVGHNFAGTVRSCYNAGTVSETYPSYSPSRVGSLVGCNFGFDYSAWDMGTGYATTENCYTVYSDTDTYGHRSFQYDSLDIYEFSEESLSNGHLTWMLNGDSSEGVWKQTLGENEHPVFDGLTVYYDEDNCVYSNEKPDSSEPEYIPDPTLQFNMNISAGADMKVVYTIYQKNLGSYTDFYLVVNKAVAGGEPVTVTYGFEEGMESFATTIIPSTGAAYMHRATFAGVYAREMGDVFEATLYAIGADGNIYYSETNASSMKSYLTGKIDAASSIDELKTMCVDMLNYGAAAQLHFAYDTENLVNADLTDEQKAYATSELPEAVNSSATDGEGVALRGSVSVKEKVYLNLTATYTPTDASALKAVICDAKGNVIAELPVTVKNNVLCQASYGEVGAKQMRQLLTATLYEGDKAVSTTITWSVESYVATVRANGNAAATQINMVNAMLTYGDAVAAYMTASGQ